MTAAELGDVARRHPRHLVLAAAVVGLLLGCRVPAPVVLAAALVSGTAAGAGARTGRGVAVAVAAAVLLTAAGSALRVRALEHTELTGLVGHVVRGPVTVVQAPRPQTFGGWAAQARFRGEPVLLRMNAPVGFGDAPAPRAPPSPEIGEIVQVRAAVKAPDEYARIVRAHAVLRAYDLRQTGARRGGAAGRVDALRRGGQRALARGPDATRGELLQGMVLGQDAGLPTDVRDDVRAAGLSHLTAASGANIVLLATLVLALAAVTGIPFRARWLIVLGLIVVYVPLAGGGPSIQRAGVMGAAGVVAMLAGRPTARWYALGLAALATLAADPRAAGDPGWQMSFAAVVALIALARPWAQRLVARRVPAPLAEAIAVTAAATLATAPIIALHFGQVSPLSLPANLVVAPVVAPIMWLGFCAAVAGPLLPPLATLLDGAADPLLRWVLGVAHAAATAPGAEVQAGVPVVAALGLCVVAAIGVRSRPRVRLFGARRRVPVAVPAAAIAVTILVAAHVLRPPAPAPVPPVAGFRVTFLDVGQGDATLLEVPGHAVLVDTGPPDAPLLDELDRAGVRRLDALVVTHAQADHQGGAAAVLARLPVGVVIDGRDGVRSPLGERFAAVARRRGVRLVPAEAGQLVRAGALTLRILSSGEGPSSGASGEDPNQRAIVAEATAGGARVLLPADAESDVLARLDLGRVDVLKVAHHGSADPGLPALLERVQPLVAGIEVGARNTYGHPAPTTLRALRGVPRTVRTDQQGTVRLDLTGGRWAVVPEREAPAPETGRGT